MPCAIDVIDTRLQSISHIQCNRSSFNQNIGSHLTKRIRKPVSVHPENRDTALTTLPLGHGSDSKPAPFSSDVQEANKVIPLTSGAPGTEGFELLSARPRILYSSVQLNERNMHDQFDSSKSVPSENPHRGNTLRQARRNRKNVCNSSTAIPPCPVVAKKSSRPVTATLKSDSDILHDDDKPPKRSPKRKGSKKRKQYRHTNCKSLNLASEITCEDNSCGVSPVEALPTNLLGDKLSETTSSASSLVKEAHLGKDENNNDYVECGTMLNLSTLGTDEMDGSECAGSSYGAMGERLSCSSVPYVNNGPYTTENTDSFFSRWNNDQSRNYSVDGDARLPIKDENRRNHLQPSPSTGLNDVRILCHLIGSHPSATHAEDTNDSFGIRSCCSKDVTDSGSHTERVQCSSEACSSMTCLQFSSGRNSRKLRKTPSYSDLTVSNKVANANRYKNCGKDSSAAWQKIEKMDKTLPRAGHMTDSPIHDKSAQEDTNKVVQKDPTRHRAKHNQRRKACKQESPNETVEMESTKEEEDTLNSCRTFHKSIYKKQAPFLHQQRSSSSQQGSQSMKNYYAPKNGIPKVPKDYSHEEGSPMLQLVHVKDTSNSCSADEVILTGVASCCPTEGNEILHSGIEKAALASCNLVPDLTPQAASNKALISITQEDPHYLYPGNKCASTIWSSRNLCADPCTTEMEGARSVKLTIENNPQEYSAAGYLSQKWVPVGKKEMPNVIHSDISEASAVEGSVPADGISDAAGLAYNNGKDRKLVSALTSKLNSSEHVDLKWQAYNGTVTGYKITEAISDVFMAHQRVEDIQLRIGRPLADFEQFILSASPVVHRSPCPTHCKSYLQECVKDGLCLHRTPDITLSSVWQWYEEHGCYGLEVKAQDFFRSKGLSNSRSQFTTYFVPYLSAVQLFGQPKRSSGGTIDKEAVNMVTCETSPCLNLPPIFTKLLPQPSKPRSKSSTLCTEDDQQSTSRELIFEFFESEQPYWRRQLFDRVNELIAGVKPSNCQISGDPKNLERSLHDLHPASWYCVAWYPIYRIPDGKFQAAFLTYHSLGHWIHRSSSADQAPVALPVIGLQSYNDKAELWFQMSKSDSEDAESAESQASSREASQVLKERLRTLNQAASVMSRADVLKNGQMSRNRHPDYEFFLSRS